MRNIRIKEMLDSEADVCAEVIRRSFSTVANEFSLTKENCPTNGAFIQKDRLIFDKQKGVLMFALHKENNTIGFVALENKGGSIFEMEKLAVLPQFRHLGYGKYLIDFAKEYASGSGGKKITIGIIEENARLKSWYMKYGFIHTGTKVFPHLPFTVGFMELNIISNT